MTRNTRFSAEITRRRENVARLRLRGLSLREIVTALARMKDENGQPDPIITTVTTVHRDMNVITAEWRERAQADIAQLKAEQLAELREVKRRAWSANDLANLLRAIKQETEIVGTDAPRKVDLDWRRDVPNPADQAAIARYAELSVLPAWNDAEAAEFGSLRQQLFAQVAPVVTVTDETE